MRVTMRRAFDALLLCALVATVGRYAANGLPGQDRPAVSKTVAVGDRWAIKGVRWDEYSRHVVLAISPSCPACNKSVEFYRRLIATVPKTSRVVVISPEPESETVSWLRAADLPVGHVAIVKDFPEIGLALTPTILLVDGNGVVSDIILRMVAPEMETRLLARVRDPGTPNIDNSRRLREIDQRTAEEMLASGAQLLDPRTREDYAAGHRAGAVNIPTHELAVRGRVELLRTKAVVIDCTRPGAGVCRSAGWILADQQFGDLALLLR